jgi:hypothetical protein
MQVLKAFIQLLLTFSRQGVLEAVVHLLDQLDVISSEA